MLWFHFPAYFFAGAFFANFVPHFVSGVLGRTFPTPFASPPFRGPSSPRVNVLYGLCNLAVAYTLLSRVGDFEPRSALHVGRLRARPRRDVAAHHALAGAHPSGGSELSVGALAVVRSETAPVVGRR